jgi:hypothetical protein
LDCIATIKRSQFTEGVFNPGALEPSTNGLLFLTIISVTNSERCHTTLKASPAQVLWSQADDILARIGLPAGRQPKMHRLLHDARCAFSTEIYTLGDAVPMHAPLESSMRVTNVIPLGYPLPLTVTTVNPVQTLKATHGWGPALHWLHHAGVRAAVESVLAVGHRLRVRGDGKEGCGPRAAHTATPSLVAVLSTAAAGCNNDQLLPILPPEVWFLVMRFFLRRDWPTPRAKGGGGGGG